MGYPLPLASPLTDQLQGWGSALGALFAGIAAVGAGLLYWHEVRTHREQRLEAEIAQARMVVATIARAEGHVDGRQTIVTHVNCRVENWGAAPVLDVEFAVSQTTGAEAIYFRRYPVLRPHVRREGRVELPRPLVANRLDDLDLLTGFNTTVVFTDSSGVRWSRVDGDQPTRVHPHAVGRALPKSDFQAAPVPGPDAENGQGVASRDEIERTLAQIWSQVLGVEQVGVEDNFFELGGDSILSIQVVSRARQAGLRFTGRDMFRRQTIAQLATVVDVNGSSPVPAPKDDPRPPADPLDS